MITYNQTVKDVEDFVNLCSTLLLKTNVCSTQTEVYRYIASKVGAKPSYIERVIRGEMKTVRVHVYLNLQELVKTLKHKVDVV